MYFVLEKFYSSHHIFLLFWTARDNDRKERGFPESAYRVSKTAEIAYTLLQSRLLKPRNVIVNGVDCTFFLLIYFLSTLVLPGIRKYRYDESPGASYC